MTTAIDLSKSTIICAIIPLLLSQDLHFYYNGVSYYVNRNDSKMPVGGQRTLNCYRTLSRTLLVAVTPIASHDYRLPVVITAIRIPPIMAEVWHWQLPFVFFLCSAVLVIYPMRARLQSNLFLGIALRARPYQKSNQSRSYLWRL